MENEKTVTIQIRLTRNKALVMLAAFFLCWHPKSLGSETLTLTTYYPAPYGGYANMLTTGQTLLARDSGNVGIGTSSPGRALDVRLATTQTGRIMDVGNVTNGDFGGLSIGNNGTLNYLGFTASGGTDMVIDKIGNVGISVLSPSQKLEVNGNAKFSDTGKLYTAGDVRVGILTDAVTAGGVTGDLYVNNKIKGMCTEYDYSVGTDQYCGDSREKVFHAYSPTALSKCASGGSLFLGGNLEDGTRWVQHYESACSGKIVCCRIE